MEGLWTILLTPYKEIPRNSIMLLSYKEDGQARNRIHIY